MHDHCAAEPDAQRDRKPEHRSDRARDGEPDTESDRDGRVRRARPRDDDH